MRDIKFRGKRLNNGEWVYGNLINHPDGHKSICNNPTRYGYGTVEGFLNLVDHETVGQYTGLKDKNDKEICEGDILICKQYIGGNFVDYAIEKGYVDFTYGAFGLHRKQGYYRPFKDWLEDYELEVIGNIHNNPELLEVD